MVLGLMLLGRQMFHTAFFPGKRGKMPKTHRAEAKHTATLTKEESGKTLRVRCCHCQAYPSLEFCMIDRLLVLAASQVDFLLSYNSQQGCN